MSSRARSRCFIIVLARRDGPLQRKPLALTAHTHSIEQFRVAAMAAAEQVVELYGKRRDDLRILTLDVDGPPSTSVGTSPYSWQVLRDQVESDQWWLSARGRLSRTLDGKLLCDRVRKATAGTLSREDALVVITNQELTPPPEWTYLLWNTDVEKSNAVISACQMDPYYWSGNAKDRFSILQARLHAAMCAAVGELAGLSRCDNEACYMCRDVVSVDQLDEMTGYGPEHALDGVT